MWRDNNELERLLRKAGMSEEKIQESLADDYKMLDNIAEIWDSLKDE